MRGFGVQGRGSRRDRPRIVLMSNTMDVGGAEGQIIQLAGALEGRGHEVHLASLLPPRGYGTHPGVGQLRLPLTRLRLSRRSSALSAIWQAVRFLKCASPDILISFVYQANVLARIAGRLAGVPVIISSVRNEQLGGWGHARDLVMRATDHFASITTTNSTTVAEALVERRVVPSDRLMVVPNGLDTRRYREAECDRLSMRRSLLVSDEQFLWMAVGNLREQKDFSTLIRAFALINPLEYPAQLRIAGEGHLQLALEAEIERLSVGDRVRLLGLRTDVPSLLAAADCLALSSAWEGLPNVILEGMAAALPIVATRVGGVAELVEHGRTGYLVPPRDVNAMADAMQQMMARSESERRGTGALGRSIVEERFDWPMVMESWFALIDSYSIASASAADAGY